MSNQFNMLCQKLVKLSNRPDVIEEIKIQLRQATLAIHHLDFFHRDLVSGLITNTAGRQHELTIPLSTFPRVRAIKSIVPYFSRQYGMAPQQCSKELTPNPSLEHCRCNTNWWRTNGGNLTISANYATHEYEMYFYQNPKLYPDEEYSSWVADLYEEALLDWTLMLLFEVLRDTSASDRYRGRVGSRDRLPTGHIAVILSEQLEQNIRSY